MDNKVITKEQAKEQTIQQDSAATFDKSRSNREDVLDKVDKLLGKIGNKKRANQKELFAIISELFGLLAAHEGLLQAMMSDFLEMIKYVQTIDKNVATLSLTLSALLNILSEKKLVSEEELTNKWKGVAEKLKEEIKKEEEKNE